MDSNLNKMYRMHLKIAFFLKIECVLTSWKHQQHLTQYFDKKKKKDLNVTLLQSDSNR